MSNCDEAPWQDMLERLYLLIIQEEELDEVAGKTEAAAPAT